MNINCQKCGKVCGRIKNVRGMIVAPNYICRECRSVNEIEWEPGEGPRLPGSPPPPPRPDLYPVWPSQKRTHGETTYCVMCGGRCKGMAMMEFPQWAGSSIQVL